MDFLCCLERWTCASRPRVSIIKPTPLHCPPGLFSFAMTKVKLPAFEAFSHVKSLHVVWTSISSLAEWTFYVEGLWKRGEEKNPRHSAVCLDSALMSRQFVVIFLYTKCPKGAHSSLCATSTECIWRCTLAVCRLEWWITKVGTPCVGAKNVWMQCCKYKHLVFHRATGKKGCSFYDNPALHNAISRLTATYADVCRSVAFCSIEPSLFSKPVTLA